MISRIEGTLEQVGDGSAHVRCGPLVYEVLVPAADEHRLLSAVGDTVTFETLHYLESHGQGASFWPKLIGFSSARDRAFFELFTTVKGIGVRKALRALQIPFHRVAEAIVSRDTALLMTLPEIGRRTAEAIIVELKEKTTPFVKHSGSGAGPAASQGSTPSATSGGGTSNQPLQPSPCSASKQYKLVADAVSVLVQLGEHRSSAMDLVERALETQPDVDGSPQLVTAALRLRSL